jgi:hypothetical protein
MLVVKQTRAFPPEFTVHDHEEGHGNGVNAIQFNGPHAKELADEYVAFKDGSLKIAEPAADVAQEPQPVETSQSQEGPPTSEEPVVVPGEAETSQAGETQERAEPAASEAA